MTTVNGTSRGMAADLLADLVAADTVEAAVVRAEHARPKPRPRRAATRIDPVDVAARTTPEIGLSGYLRLALRDLQRPSLTTQDRGLALHVGPLRAGLHLI